MKRGFWLGLAALALLWPARTISWLDGIPFDRPAEAVIVALAIPALACLAPGFVETLAARVLIVMMLAVKLAGATVLTQQGLCAQFGLDAPLTGSIPKPSQGAAQSIPVEAPGGVLHSWDARADWRNSAARCTAIVARSYPSQADFPAWFLNLTRNVEPPRADLTLRLSGFIVADAPGRLTFTTSGPMSGTVDGVRADSSPSDPVARSVESSFDLPIGTHQVDLTLPLQGDDWRLVGTWNHRDLWTAAVTTATRPTTFDRSLSRAGGALVSVLTAGLVLAWAAYAWSVLSPGAALISWTAFASLLLAVAARQPHLVRLAAIPLLFAPLVPVPDRLRNSRGVFLLVGLPWLALFAALSLSQVGRFTLYSGDDWLTYQVAGYRIFMGGYWLEGGNAVFNYQPLYRWMSGGLHMVFGDSSVGEVYWDAACLLMGAVLSFRLVEERAGFRAGAAAAALTLATFSLGPIWYFVGRGLSEIAAAGWGFIAAFLLLRARVAGSMAAVIAGGFATLMFYTRLNHLIFMFGLVALLLPASVPAVAWPALAELAALIRSKAARVYGSVLVGGIGLFALRNWHYTGAFSVLEGTSLAINDTGLRLTTLGSSVVWQRIVHSLLATVWMNEPPRPDPRALLLAAGVVLAVLAVCQVQKVRILPLGLCLTILGGTAAAFLAHTHNYPGRMSIHLVPFAVALVVTATARMGSLSIER